MQTTLPTNIIENITDAINDACLDEAAIMKYSGRFMYGQECLGVVFPSVREYGYFLVSLTIYTDEDTARDLAEKVRTDSMGMDTVFYWPHISFYGFTENDEDEDDDN